jgi:hypothetical protein
VSSIGEDFPNQQANARELLAMYREIGPAGQFGEAVVEHALRCADEAMASGDIVAIMRSYAELKALK